MLVPLEKPTRDIHFALDPKTDAKIQQLNRKLREIKQELINERTEMKFKDAIFDVKDGARKLEKTLKEIIQICDWIKRLGGNHEFNYESVKSLLAVCDFVLKNRDKFEDKYNQNGWMSYSK